MCGVGRYAGGLLNIAISGSYGLAIGMFLGISH